jgi:hypothetical protein
MRPAQPCVLFMQTGSFDVAMPISLCQGRNIEEDTIVEFSVRLVYVDESL